VTLWRIATETREYKANDLSGMGAAKKPGRWNDDHEPVIYAAQTISLAVLETAARFDDAGLPQNRFIVEISVRASLWKRRKSLKEENLDPAWAAIPAGRASVEIGSSWLRSAESALLLVPSVVVKEEYGVLINPRHADAKSITAKTGRSFEYNRLFR
jgi:RES domain-containing protein